MNFVLNLTIIVQEFLVSVYSRILIWLFLQQVWVPCKKNVYQKGEVVGPSDKKGCLSVKIEGGDVSNTEQL